MTDETVPQINDDAPVIVYLAGRKRQIIINGATRWEHDTDCGVLSVWDGEECVATFNHGSWLLVRRGAPA